MATLRDYRSAQYAPDVPEARVLGLLNLGTFSGVAQAAPHLVCHTTLISGRSAGHNGTRTPNSLYHLILLPRCIKAPSWCLLGFHHTHHRHRGKQSAVMALQPCLTALHRSLFKLLLGVPTNSCNQKLPNFSAIGPSNHNGRRHNSLGLCGGQPIVLLGEVPPSCYLS